MASINIKSAENYISNLAITFRKLAVKISQLNNTKIMVMIKTNVYDEKAQNDEEFFTNFYQISQPRTIKNGLACFYGQCIILNQKINNFTMRVVTDNGTQSSGHRRQLAKFVIGPQQIKGITQKKAVFSSSYGKIQLIWEARTVNDQDSGAQQPQQQRSLEDFEDIQINKQQKNLNQLYYRRIYSPAVKGEFRRKKQQKKFLRDDSKSELISSQSPHKHTMDTNETLQKIKKRVILAGPIIKNQNIIVTDLKRSPRHQIQKDIQIQQINGHNKDKVSNHPVLSPQKCKPKNILNRGSIPLTPQHRSSTQFQIPKRKTERFLQRISLKSLLYTSMIGIIGGVTAAQF